MTLFTPKKLHPSPHTLMLIKYVAHTYRVTDTSSNKNFYCLN